MTPGVLLGACLVDAMVGDPRWLPHPVRLMGHAIAVVEEVVRRTAQRPLLLRLAGIGLALGLPVSVYGMSYAVIDLFGQIQAALGTVAEIALAATTLAARDLADHALAVRQALQSSLESARRVLAQIVGRDTERLSESEVVRAAVESVAESTCDGVIAPLFYLSLGGVPLALAYKAVNTLDSMVGHRTAEHVDLGWASAKLDDLANWVPARLTAGLLLLAGAVQARTIRHLPQGFHVLRRDGGKHLSPNSGRPEAAMAAVLRVRLGGTSFYEGIPEHRPYLGDAVRPLRPEDINAAVRLMWAAYLLGVAPAVAVTLL